MPRWRQGATARRRYGTGLSSLRQRLGLLLLFVLMASAGFAAYFACGRLWCDWDGQRSVPAQPRVWVPAVSAENSARAHRGPDEIDVWVAKGRRLAGVAEILLLGDVGLQ